MSGAVISMEARVSQRRGVASIRLDASAPSGIHRSIIWIRHDGLVFFPSNVLDAGAIEFTVNGLGSGVIR